MRFFPFDRVLLIREDCGVKWPKVERKGRFEMEKGEIKRPEKTSIPTA
jgi:hypothetical protein